MKTLVIHPLDQSTGFLFEIYRDKGYTVVNDLETCRSRKKITELIKAHGRVMCLGHGGPTGLFYTCINPELVYLLKKKEIVFIWCHADKFVERYGLVGFYTRMFISEVAEAAYYGIKTTQDKIDYSNNLFASEFRKYESMLNVHNLIKEAYIGECPVIQFNNERLCERNEESILNYKDLKDELLLN